MVDPVAVAAATESRLMLIDPDAVGPGGMASMTCASLMSIVDKHVLYLTTVGRRTGLPREIEIWFVVWC